MSIIFLIVCIYIYVMPSSWWMYYIHATLMLYFWHNEAQSNYCLQVSGHPSSSSSVIHAKFSSFFPPLLPAAAMVVVKIEGPPILCKTDEIGELCVSSESVGGSFWGLKGKTNGTFNVSNSFLYCLLILKWCWTLRVHKICCLVFKDDIQLW